MQKYHKIGCRFTGTKSNTREFGANDVTTSNRIRFKNFITSSADYERTRIFDAFSQMQFCE